MSKSLLELAEVEKSFFTPAKLEVLKGINLKVESGSSVAIIGASGEGKSTLLHITGGLESPTNGQVLLQGEKLITPKQRNESIGFVFQSFHLLEDMSALQNVLMPAIIARKEEQYKKRAEELIEQVGLKQRKNFPVKLLSGGEKQRLCIARALCLDPPLLIADEPSGNLDSENSMIVHNLLVNLAKQHKKALLVATHSKLLAELCDKTFTLNSGKLHC